MPALTLSQVLFSQGFGTRRECEALIRAGRVQIDGTAMIDAAVAVDTRGLQFSVDGVRWPYHARAVVALNKPAGSAGSQKPSHHPAGRSLLRPRLRARGVRPG
ncbi:MAG: S4 domain-containing protein, partial [Betaproteobacteria bacterium]